MRQQLIVSCAVESVDTLEHLSTKTRHPRGRIVDLAIKLLASTKTPEEIGRELEEAPKERLGRPKMVNLELKTKPAAVLAALRTCEKATGGLWSFAWQTIAANCALEKGQTWRALQELVDAKLVARRGWPQSTHNDLGFANFDAHGRPTETTFVTFALPESIPTDMRESFGLV